MFQNWLCNASVQLNLQQCFEVQMIKPKLILNANLIFFIFGLFTIDGDKKVHDDYGHHHDVYTCTGLVEIVSINF